VPCICFVFFGKPKIIASPDILHCSIPFDLEARVEVYRLQAPILVVVRKAPVGEIAENRRASNMEQVLNALIAATPGLPCLLPQSNSCAPLGFDSPFKDRSALRCHRRAKRTPGNSDGNPTKLRAAFAPLLKIVCALTGATPMTTTDCHVE